VLDEDPGQLAAQDLQLGGRSVGTAVTDRERRRGRAVLPDEPHAHLGGVGRADVGEDSHPIGHFSRGAADVDVLALVAALRVALEDRRPPAAGGELMSEGGAGDTGAGDDGVHLAILPSSGRSTHQPRPRTISPSAYDGGVSSCS
jgi:hypothetical protein